MLKKALAAAALLTAGAFAAPFTCTWEKAQTIGPEQYEQIVKAFKEKYSMHYDGSGVVLDKRKSFWGKYELLVEVVPACKQEGPGPVICKFLPQCIRLEVSKKVYDHAYAPPKCEQVGPNKWTCYPYSEIVTKDKAIDSQCIPMEYVIGGKEIKTDKIQLCTW